MELKRRLSTAQPQLRPPVADLRVPLASPSPAEIRAARAASGMTQRDAAALVGLSHASRWAEHESDTRPRPMDSARWELFLLKTNQHPLLSVSPQRPGGREQTIAPMSTQQHGAGPGMGSSGVQA